MARTTQPPQSASKSRIATPRVSAPRVTTPHVAASHIAASHIAAPQIADQPRVTQPCRSSGHTPPAGAHKAVTPTVITPKAKAPKAIAPKVTTPKPRTPPDADTRHKRLVARALRSLEARAREPGITLSNARVLAEWFRLRLAEYEHEVFAAAWLDTRLRLIRFELLSQGTLDRAPVHIREVVKAALRANAAAVAFAHNHPSGWRRPSPDDIAITDDLRYALSLIGVRLIDHFLVAQAAPPHAMPRKVRAGAKRSSII